MDISQPMANRLEVQQYPKGRSCCPFVTCLRCVDNPCLREALGSAQPPAKWAAIPGSHLCPEMFP